MNSNFIYLQNQTTIPDNPEETMTNMSELHFFFERIGVGLNKDEVYWYEKDIE